MSVRYTNDDLTTPLPVSRILDLLRGDNPEFSVIRVATYALTTSDYPTRELASELCRVLTAPGAWRRYITRADHDRCSVLLKASAAVVAAGAPTPEQLEQLAVMSVETGLWTRFEFFELFVGVAARATTDSCKFTLANSAIVAAHAEIDSTCRMTVLSAIGDLISSDDTAITSKLRRRGLLPLLSRVTLYESKVGEVTWMLSNIAANTRGDASCVIRSGVFRSLLSQFKSILACEPTSLQADHASAMREMLFVISNCALWGLNHKRQLGACKLVREFLISLTTALGAPMWLVQHAARVCTKVIDSDLTLEEYGVVRKHLDAVETIQTCLFETIGFEDNVVNGDDDQPDGDDEHNRDDEEYDVCDDEDEHVDE